jgi:hypothetical protein
MASPIASALAMVTPMPEANRWKTMNHPKTTRTRQEPKSMNAPSDNDHPRVDKDEFKKSYDFESGRASCPEF